MAKEMTPRRSVPAFAFPVLCLTPDGDIWAVGDDWQLSTCGPETLRDRVQVGMLTIDVTGRAHRVLSVELVGRAPFVFGRTRLFAPQLYRIQHEFAPERTRTLEEVKALVCDALNTFPTDWCDASELPDGLERRKAVIAAAPSIQAIHDDLGLDYFAY